MHPSAEDHKKLKEPDNLGFGTQIVGRHFRLLEKNGRYNVRTIGSNYFSLYQDLVEMTWGRFFLLVMLFFLLVNSFFALLLLWAGIDCLSGIEKAGFLQNFADVWFFSVQTLTTVGYGSVSPVCFSTNLVASFIALSGLMTFALATGLFFARFSKPVSQIRFSKSAVIAPYRDHANGFMFRVANRRDNQIIDLEARVVMSWVDSDGKGGKKRRFQQLGLEVDKVAMLPLSWTIVHPIDPKSALHGMRKEDLEAKEVEVIVQVKGHDETFSQTVHAHMSYGAEEIYCGYKFNMMYYPGADGKTILDLGRIDDMMEAPLK